MAGRPFPKISDEQRAAYTLGLKKDGIHLLRDLGAATVEHLQNNPQSMITQTIQQVERDTGAVTMFARALRTFLHEKQAAAQQAQQAQQAQDPEIKVEPKDSKP